MKEILSNGNEYLVRNLYLLQIKDTNTVTWITSEEQYEIGQIVNMKSENDSLKGERIGGFHDFVVIGHFKTTELTEEQIENEEFDAAMYYFCKDENEVRSLIQFLCWTEEEFFNVVGDYEKKGFFNLSDEEKMAKMQNVWFEVLSNTMIVWM